MLLCVTLSRADVNVSTGDTSGGECGVAMVHRFRMPYQNESSTNDDCSSSYNVRYWYSVVVGSVWVHSFSTAHSYFAGTEQRAWIEQDLAAAAAAKADGRVSWIVVQMHYPTYCSHPLGEWVGDSPRSAQLLCMRQGCGAREDRLDARARMTFM